MSEINAKNEYIRALNLASVDFYKIIGGLKEFYGRDFPNVANIYRDKINSLQQIFEQNNMTFFTGNILGTIILYYFDSLYGFCVKSVGQIGKNLYDIMDENYLVIKACLLFNLPLAKTYEGDCNKLKEFKLDEKLLNPIIYFYKSTKFYNYSPGWFNSSYEELKEILKKLNINIPKLDSKIKPIISKREKQISELYQCIKEEFGTSEENVRDYIDNIVKETEQELAGKQKKR